MIKYFHYFSLFFQMGFTLFDQFNAGKWTSVVQDGKVDLLGISDFNGEQASVPPVSTLVAYQ